MSTFNLTYTTFSNNLLINYYSKSINVAVAKNSSKEADTWTYAVSFTSDNYGLSAIYDFNCPLIKNKINSSATFYAYNPASNTYTTTIIKAVAVGY